MCVYMGADIFYQCYALYLQLVSLSSSDFIARSSSYSTKPFVCSVVHTLNLCFITPKS